MLLRTIGEDSIRKYVLPAFTVLIWVSYPFIRFNNILVEVFAAYMLVIGWPFGRFNWRRDLVFLLPIVLFMAFIVGLFWTTDLHEGWKQLEKKLALLSLPLIFFFAKRRLQLTDVRRMLWAFVAVCVSIVIYCLIIAVYNMIKHDSLTVVEFKERTYYYFSYIPLTQPAQIDPIYLSLYINFSLLVVLMLPAARWIRICLLVFLIAANILVASKIGLLVMGVVFVLFTLTYLRNRKVAILICVIGIASFGLTLVSSKFLRERFVVSTKFDYEVPYAGEWNSTSQRIAIWLCAYDAASENFPLGHGTTEGQRALHKAYVEKNYIRGYEDNYNAHNEYLFTWLDLGIFGFIILIAMIIVPAVRSIGQQQYLFAFFLVVCALYFMVEVVLARRLGLHFFGFFYGLLATVDFIYNTHAAKDV